MNLSPSALNKLWQKQTKAAPQQTSKQSGGKEANSESVAAHPYGLLFTFLPQVFTFQHNIHQDEFDFSD
jgi:hypothetical protein